MRIGLLADTQGSFDVDALLRYVADAFVDVDEIWHAGDWGTPEVLAGLARLRPPIKFLPACGGGSGRGLDSSWSMGTRRTIRGTR